MTWRVSEAEKRMVELIEQGIRNIEHVVDIVSEETSISNKKIFDFCKEFYKEAKKADMILLKQSVPNFPKTNTMALFSLGGKPN